MINEWNTLTSKQVQIVALKAQIALIKPHISKKEYPVRYKKQDKRLESTRTTSWEAKSGGTKSAYPMKHMSKSSMDQHGITTAIIKHWEDTQVKAASRQSLIDTRAIHSLPIRTQIFTCQRLT
jgi:hypothetical protein